jgi:hypothetical protein
MEAKTQTIVEARGIEDKANAHLKQLQQATLQAAFAAAENGDVPTLADALAVADRGVNKNTEKSGNLPPGPGRPKGVRNKLTNLREAVLEAFDTVGGPEYLVRLANGTQSDRAAFVGLVSKVLPTQINANVEGGIQVQLSWLGARNIGATTTQNVEQVTQVIDLERDKAGKYRIIDPVSEGESPRPAENSQTPTPHQSAGGAGL